MKNIIFDLGGVVVDWDPERILKEYPGGDKLPEVLFKKGFFRQFWTEFDRGMVTQEEVAEQLSEFSEKEYEECWDFIEYIKCSLVDIPQTVELIKELSADGYQLFCLSNMSIEFYDYLRERDVFGYFDGQVISGLEKTVKPEEEIYRILQERYGLVPEESLFIDDLQHNLDVANGLGFHTVNFSDKAQGYKLIRKVLKNGRS